MAEKHIHLLVTASLNKKYYDESITFLENWFTELVSKIDMNILIPPKVVYCDNPGNEGLTGLVCIDTSHSSIHMWNSDSPYLKFDLYSCKDFSVNIVLEQIKMLDVSMIEYILIDRGNEAEHTILDKGSINYG